MWLFSEDNTDTPIGFNDDSGAYGSDDFTTAARIITRLAPGTYYVKVVAHDMVNQSYADYGIIVAATPVIGAVPQQPRQPTIVPNNPLITDDLVAVLDAVDGISDDVTVHYRWYLDKAGDNVAAFVEVPGRDSATIPSEVTRTGQRWRVSVYLEGKDGDLSADSDPSIPVTISSNYWDVELQAVKTFANQQASVDTATIGWASASTNGFDKNVDVQLPSVTVPGPLATADAVSAASGLAVAAATAGDAGNGISVTVTVGAPGPVAVPAAKTITVTVAAGTTSADVAALINADAGASALVVATGNTSTHDVTETITTGGGVDENDTAPPGLDLLSGTFVSEGLDTAYPWLTSDFRPFGQDTTWYLRLDTGDAPSEVELRWDEITEVPLSLPINFVEVDPANNYAPVPGKRAVNMLTNNSYSVDLAGGQVKWFRVQIGRTADSTTLTIYPGWNLVSLPLVPYNSNPRFVFSDESGQVFIGKIWRYGREEAGRAQNYQAVKEIKSGEAYWVYSVRDTAATVVVYGTSGSGFANLNEGWNLIGPSLLHGRSSGTLPTVIDNDNKAHYFINKNSDGSPADRYESTTTLKRNVGYWLWWGGEDAADSNESISLPLQSQ
jgi:hypothetical protein